MWEKYRLTQLSRRAIYLANLEAYDLGQSEVDTEHLLLTLVRDSDNLAMRIIEEGLAIPRLDIYKELRRGIKRGGGSVSQEIRLTERTMRVIDLADEEAKGLGVACIGMESLLLGLAREEEGLAGRVLRKVGADVESLRAQIRAMAEDKESLLWHIRNRFLQIAERDTGLPIRSLVSAAVCRDPKHVTDAITPFLALSPEDREAVQSLPSPRERLDKLSTLLEAATLRLRAPRPDSQ